MRVRNNCWLILLVIISVFPEFLYAQTEGQEYGFVKFDYNLDDIFIIVDDELSSAFKYDPELLIRLEEGERKITVVHKDINDFSYRIDVYADSTTVSKVNIQTFTRNPKSSYAVLNEGRNIVINTEPEGQIYIDEELIGTGTTSSILSPGKYELMILHPEHGVLKTSLNASQYKIQEFSRFNQNHNPPSTFQRFIPGFSYLNTKRYMRAALTYISLGTVAYLALDNNSSFNDLNRKFDEYQFNYLNAESFVESERNRIAALNTLHEMEVKRDRLTYSLIGFGIVYAISSIDGLRKPKGGYKGNIKFTPELVEVGNASKLITPAVKISASF